MPIFRKEFDFKCAKLQGTSNQHIVTATAAQSVYFALFL